DDHHDAPEEVYGCRVRRTRTVDVTALRSPPGTNFRCAYPGHIDEPGMFNDYIVDSEIDISGNPAMQEVREEPKLGAVCTERDCHDRGSPAEDSQKGLKNTSPRVFSPSSRSAILFFVVCVFHWLYSGAFTCLSHY
ncbi:hypothetical protein EGW08_018062, partial [Elysia chlorotica]